LAERRGNNLVGVCRSSAGCAINQQIHAVTACAIDGITDEWVSAQKDDRVWITRSGYAVESSNQRVGIAWTTVVPPRAFDPASGPDWHPPDSGYPASASTVTVSCYRNFKHDIQVAHLSNLQHDCILDVLLESGISTTTRHDSFLTANKELETEPSSLVDREDRRYLWQRP